MCSKAAIELLATWAAALSAGRVFPHYLIKKKEHKDLPKNLSECTVSKKRMGPITLKTSIIWISRAKDSPKRQKKKHL